MTAELLILLHYFKGKAAPLLRCLSCHFLFPHFVPARAGGSSAPGWPDAPGRVPAATAPLRPGAILGNSSPSSRCPLWAAQPQGWGVPRLGCPGQVPGQCPRDVRGSLASVGGGVAAASSALPPIVLAAVLGSGVSACYFQSMAPTAAPGAAGRLSPLARSPDPAGTAGMCRGDSRNTGWEQGGSGPWRMRSPLLPLHAGRAPAPPSPLSPSRVGFRAPGCRDPAEPRRSPTCPDPAPGGGLRSLPVSHPRQRGRSGAESFPSPARGVSRPPGDPGATEPGLPSATQPGRCHQGRVGTGAGWDPLRDAEPSPASGVRDKGWDRPQGQRQGRGCTQGQG